MVVVVGEIGLLWGSLHSWKKAGYKTNKAQQDISRILFIFALQFSKSLKYTWEHSRFFLSQLPHEDIVRQLLQCYLFKL